MTHQLSLDKQKKLVFSAWMFLAIFYLIVRFGFTRQLDQMGAYTSYIFEIMLTLVAVFFSRTELKTMFSIPKGALASIPLSFLAGFFIFEIAVIQEIRIPFNLGGTETVIFLLLVAPILEEFIFRFFLYEPVHRLAKSSVVPWIFTTVIFSYSHLHAIWFVPEAIHQFIIYQTIYTLGLGLACGFFVFRYRSLGCAIIVHFLFNLGFYVGSRF
jgi:membrane protease YdiL (CAAX protease family)